MQIMESRAVVGIAAVGEGLLRMHFLQLVSQADTLSTFCW